MKKYIKYIIIIALIVAAFAVWSHYRKAKNRPEWRTGNASYGEIREVVTATGSLNPYVSVTVGTEVSGKIAKLYKDFNDTVKKGELLATLDTDILSSNLETAKGELARNLSVMEETKLDFDLQTKLFKQNMTSEYDLQKAEFQYQQAKQTVANSRLSVQRAQKNLDNAYITSPISGIIVSREVEVGQTVAASMSSPTLFIIANNLDQMQITANVDEADIGKITLGMPVEFTVDAHPEDNFTGQVNQIRLNPTTDENVVSYSVIVDAANPEHKLLPGMTSNVTFIIQAKENVMRIPETATRFKPSKEVWAAFGLKWDEKSMEGNKSWGSKGGSKAASGQTKTIAAGTPGGNSRAGKLRNGSKMAGASMQEEGRSASVWVLENNVPKQVSIRTGVSDGSFVEVISGLNGKETLITGVNNKNSQANTDSQNSPRGPMGRF